MEWRTILDYWLYVISRIFERAKKFFGWNPGTILSIFLYGIGTLIYLFLKGREAAMDEFLITAIYALAPAGLILILFVLWNLAAVPALIDFEAREKIDSLTVEPIDIRYELAKLRRTGVEVRNSLSDFIEINETENMLAIMLIADPWIKKTYEWSDQVVSTLKQHDKADAERFDILDAVPSARVPCPINKGYIKQLFNHHDFRLVKLDNLIEKYRNN